MGSMRNAKAMEAEIISRATQTATVAARSILMSGGSEEVALKTAKAAAESVLNPMLSDSDTVSTRSTLGSAFGGRKRKAKRQAEVVASMALMSATSAIRTAGSSMSVSEWDSGQNNPYGRNIITYGQDETSVLSGSISTRPPRIPTPKSYASNVSVSGPQPKKASPSPPSAAAVNQRSPLSTGSHRGFESCAGLDPSQSIKMKVASPKANAKDCSAEETVKVKATDEVPSTNFLDKILNVKVGDTTPKNAQSDQNESDKLFQMESDSFSRSDTMDSDRQSSIGTSTGDDSTANDTATEDGNSKKESNDGELAWKVSFDPLLMKVTNTLSLLTCGPLGPFMNGQAADDVEDVDTIATNSVSRARESTQGRRPSTAIDSRDDTFDDNTTNYTGDDTNTTGERETRDEYDEEDYSNYRDPDFGSRSSGSSKGILRGLGMSEEGAIQVRSSIRETMEKIVSKSKRSQHRRTSGRSSHSRTSIKSDRRGTRQPGSEMKYLSYESRQRGSDTEIPVAASKKRTKRSSSSSRRTPRRKNTSGTSIGKKTSFFFGKPKAGY